jgi:hypothetical protein
MCSTSASKCPVVKGKNSASAKMLYSSGKRISQKDQYQKLSQETKSKIAWSRGLTKETDERIKKAAINQIGRPSRSKGFKHTEEFKQARRENRLRIIELGIYDSSGRKGHRGHYDNIYFHSSWELAYYVWLKEVFGKSISRNTSRIKYIYDCKEYEYIPDFICDNELIEIKGYVWSDRDKIKYEKTKDLVKYLFKSDLIASIEYCKTNYGKKYWEKLYG